jgi:proline iminopeptidase
LWLYLQVIVQGRYDVVCPATSAVELQRALPGAKLVLTITGHSATEPEIIQELVRATDQFRYVNLN